MSDNFLTLLDIKSRAWFEYTADGYALVIPDAELPYEVSLVDGTFLFSNGNSVSRIDRFTGLDTLLHVDGNHVFVFEKKEDYLGHVKGLLSLLSKCSMSPRALLTTMARDIASDSLGRLKLKVSGDTVRIYSTSPDYCMVQTRPTRFVGCHDYMLEAPLHVCGFNGVCGLSVAEHDVVSCEDGVLVVKASFDCLYWIQKHFYSYSDFDDSCYHAINSYLTGNSPQYSSNKYRLRDE